MAAGAGILASVLVCLAVWMTFTARSVQGKIITLVLPIATFAVAGLEHSVANMSPDPGQHRGWRADRGRLLVSYDREG